MNDFYVQIKLLRPTIKVADEHGKKHEKFWLVIWLLAQLAGANVSVARSSKVYKCNNIQSLNAQSSIQLLNKLKSTGVLECARMGSNIWAILLTLTLAGSMTSSLDLLTDRKFVSNFFQFFPKVRSLLSDQCVAVSNYFRNHTSEDWAIKCRFFIL